MASRLAALVATSRLRTIAAAAVVAAVTATPAAAAQGTPGPFPGVVTQGQTRTHAFDNDPADQGCPHVMTTCTVLLAYTPASDVLTLSVGSSSATGSNGQASLSLSASWCTAFDIRVTGTSVRAAAGYVVTVIRGGPTA